VDSLSFFAGWSRRSGRRNRHAFGQQLQFDLAEAQRLAGFQNAFGDFLAVDEGAIGGTKVLDDDFTAPQNNFAMMAGDGRIGDLKRIVLHTTNSGCVHIQLVGAPVESRAKDDKFRHRLRHVN